MLYSMRCANFLRRKFFKLFTGIRQKADYPSRNRRLLMEARARMDGGEGVLNTVDDFIDSGRRQRWIQRKRQLARRECFRQWQAHATVGSLEGGQIVNRRIVNTGLNALSFQAFGNRVTFCG